MLEEKVEADDASVEALREGKASAGQGRAAQEWNHSCSRGVVMRACCAASANVSLFCVLPPPRRARSLSSPTPFR